MASEITIQADFNATNGYYQLKGGDTNSPNERKSQLC